MKRSIGLPLILAIAAMAGASPAPAQYYPSPRVVYVPAPAQVFALHHAEAVVRSLGLRPVSRPEARGPVLVIHALGQEGSQVVVTLDRYSGRVLGIVRAGYGAPRFAVVPGAPVYDDEDYASLDDGPPSGVYPAPRERFDTGQGPLVITRRGIEADELPPPGAVSRGREREPYFAGSIPRGVYRMPPGGDPLVGVPKEFRGQASRSGSPHPRVAARGPETLPRNAPMPRPRPAGAADVAVKDANPPEARARQQKAPQYELSPAAKADAEKFPPMQGFE